MVQVYQLEKAITEALLKKGFSLVEVISPCPVSYGRMNNQATGLEQMEYYRGNSVIKHGISPKNADIDFNGQIVVGKFVDMCRPYLPSLRGGDNGKSV